MIIVGVDTLCAHAGSNEIFVIIVEEREVNGCHRFRGCVCVHVGHKELGDVESLGG